MEKKAGGVIFRPGEEMMQLTLMQMLFLKKISPTPVKIRILLYLSKQKKKVTITKASRDLNIDYKNLWRYLQLFKAADIITLQPSEKTQGKKTYITFNWNKSEIVGYEKKISKLLAKSK